MTLDEIQVVIYAASGPLALATAIFGIIPWCLRSLFRYRMWAIRDAIYGDIRAGRLPRHRASWSLLSRTESAIVDSRDVALLTLLVLEAISLPNRRRRDEMYASYEEEWQSALQELSEAHRALARSYETSWKNQVAIQVFTGTPLGWVGSLVSVAAVVPVVLVQMLTSPREHVKRAKELAKERLRPLRDNVAQKAEYERSAARGRKRQLARHAA